MVEPDHGKGNVFRFSHARQGRLNLCVTKNGGCNAMIDFSMSNGESHEKQYKRRQWRRERASLCVYFCVYFWRHLHGTFVVVCNHLKHLHCSCFFLLVCKV